MCVARLIVADLPRWLTRPARRSRSRCWARKACGPADRPLSSGKCTSLFKIFLFLCLSIILVFVLVLLLVIEFVMDSDVAANFSIDSVVLNAQSILVIHVCLMNFALKLSSSTYIIIFFRKMLSTGLGKGHSEFLPVFEICFGIVSKK